MKNSKLLTTSVFWVCFLCCCRWGLAVEDRNSGFYLRTDDQTVSVFDGPDLVFKFNYAFLEHKNVPNSDPRRWAGDYIYPLNGVLGENLTDNAPKDHYHHHGVFWTWPGVFIHEDDGTTRQYDLWTSDTQIRQRFIKFHKLEATQESAVICVENGWYVDGDATTPDENLDSSKKGFDISENERFYGEKIISETVCLTVRPIEVFEGIKTRSIDFELTLRPLSKDVSLQGAEHKSYGGLTIRFRPTGKIGVDEFITTDEGVANKDMPEKSLRWADYTSRFGGKNSLSGENNALSGAAIFLAPDFPDFPPTWLTRYYGPLCVGFPGVVAKRFKAQKPIVMKARIWIHEGLVSVDLLKKAYEAYASK